MKILWVGDSPTVSTGFSKCTRVVCDALVAAGHEVHILGLSYFGDTSLTRDMPYELYAPYQPLHGCYNGFGVDRLPWLIEDIKPDIVVLLNDPWNVKDYMDAIAKASIKHRPKYVGWLAVDAENQVTAIECNSLDHVIVWTDFAVSELTKGGLTAPMSVVGLGVDTNLYYPRNRKLCRSKHFAGADLPEDAFLVGVVGRNQARKRIDLSIEYFASWVKDYNVKNAYLYLHCAPTGDSSVDIDAVVAYNEINGRVFTGLPSIGIGLAEENMPELYSCFDIAMTTTTGEGWGLPIGEAQACGIPYIVPAWSALGCWAKHSTLQVPCLTKTMNAPWDRGSHTIGGIADKHAFVNALQQLYTSSQAREELTVHGINEAKSRTWEDTAAGMVKVLTEVSACP